MSKLLIKGGRIIDPANGLDAVCDLLCENGKIAEISDNISCSDAVVINAEGKIVAPGLVDMHTHLRDPGFTYKEDIVTGTRSAAAGGITSVACMPNTNPVADNEAVITYIKNKADKEAVVNVFPIGSITKGLKGDELSEMGKLKAAGAVAVSDDGKPVENAAIMRRALQYADMFDLKVISHCEIKSLAEGSMNDGETATFLGLKGIPNSAEEIMVSRDVILAEELGVPVHIAHVSTKGSIEIVRNAKKRGVKVTCETCPHYFSLTEKAVLGFNTNAKMNPPLRTDIDLEAVCKGLADGTIDAIATDHAPHHIDEKNCEFVQAMNGIVGFETSLAVSYTYLVKKGVLSLSEMISAMAAKPSQILGINKGTLSVGADADIVIFDTENEFEICSEKLFSKSKNTPYDKYRLCGKVEATVVGGKIVFDGKEITA